MDGRTHKKVENQAGVSDSYVRPRRNSFFAGSLNSQRAAALRAKCRASIRD